MATTKKTVPKKTTTKRSIKEAPTGVELPVVDVHGKAKGTVNAPKELFAAPINEQLLAQSVRVYLANQRTGGASTKTRGQVEGSTRKIYRQKGTGNARHGGIRAPIFVGGGIAFGPKPRDYRLNMPVSLRHAALASALSKQHKAGNIIVVDGMEDLELKTKKFAETFVSIGATSSTLFIVPKDHKNMVRATRNLASVESMPLASLHAYAVLSHGKIVFTKDALKTV